MALLDDAIPDGTPLSAVVERSIGAQSTARPFRVCNALRKVGKGERPQMAKHDAKR
ncbi:hypothetical protein AB0J94_25545 [Micromonospora noduli]|uniref:hypothetical protein n=1 Tax=Micromonospora noduli TaxID=709876 RepID=UPI0034140FD0